MPACRRLTRVGLSFASLFCGSELLQGNTSTDNNGEAERRGEEGFLAVSCELSAVSFWPRLVAGSIESGAGARRIYRRLKCRERFVSAVLQVR